MNKHLVVGVVIVSLLVGIGIGYALTPEYAVMRSDKANGMVELGAADRYVDLRYTDNMIAHHQAAIYLLDQVKKQSKRPELLSLADTVIPADTKDIETLYGYKKEWYNNAKKVTIYQKIQLGSADDTFDLRFLNSMIEHHEEAIASAKEIRTKSARNEILSLADSVIQTLGKSRDQLVNWRTEWYGR